MVDAQRPHLRLECVRQWPDVCCALFAYVFVCWRGPHAVRHDLDEAATANITGRRAQGELLRKSTPARLVLRAVQGEKSTGSGS